MVDLSQQGQPGGPDEMDVDDLTGGSRGNGTKRGMSVRTPAKTPRRIKVRRVRKSDDDNDDDDDVEVAGGAMESPFEVQSTRRSGRIQNAGAATKRRGGLRFVESESENEAEDMVVDGDDDENAQDDDDEEEVPLRRQRGGMAGVPRWKAALQKAGLEVREDDEGDEDDEVIPQGGDGYESAEDDEDEEDEEDQDEILLQSPRKGPVRRGGPSEAVGKGPMRGSRSVRSSRLR